MTGTNSNSLVQEKGGTRVVLSGLHFSVEKVGVCGTFCKFVLVQCQILCPLGEIAFNSLNQESFWAAGLFR